VVSQCFSQSRDELVLQFETSHRPFFIRASLQSHFCCLSFPDDFRRARKNSVDLFPELAGCRVVSINQFQNDRSFSIEFEQSLSLLFKMHGNRANIILLIDSKPVNIFRNHLKQDRYLQLHELHKPIDLTKEAFEKNLQSLERSYFTFGKPVWEYLDVQKFHSKSTAEKWGLFTQVISLLENPTYYLLSKPGVVAFSLLPGKEIVKTSTDPVKAINEFFILHNTTRSMVTEKQQAISLVQTRLNQANSYIQRNTTKLNELEQDNHFSVWADLLMAHLTTLKGVHENVELPNFYNNNLPEQIKLKTEFSIQKNAEIYYRKSKNRELELTKLKEGIAEKKQQAEVLKNQINRLQQADDLQSVRQFVKEFNLTHFKKGKEFTLPYHEVEFGGFKIWIGKNAQNNDELTQKFSYKDDLWLHAKDVPGSHVLIKYQAGKPFPKLVIERAAQLAAYYSKRKTDSICPVTVTQKKNVRKRKGDPPGMVVVEKERVLLVAPTAP
jgi:predicted ribosome quality control (RQC) complex YloA/Tae2 family protein